MTSNGDTRRTDATVRIASIRGGIAVSDALTSSAGPQAPPSAADHSSLPSDRSVALDEIYDEFCSKVEAGEDVCPEQFAARYPEYQLSVLRLIEAHQYIERFTLGGQPQQWPAPGDVVLGFRILECLGEGGLARVYLAEEIDLADRQVVIKLTLRGQTEAEIMAKLQHPLIVPIHAVVRDPDSALSAICMPYVGRITLAQLIGHLFTSGTPLRSQAILAATHQLNPSSVVLREDPKLRRGDYATGALLLGCQIAEALAHAHSLGVSHGDMKPSNVLLSFECRLMLLDFNLSADRCDSVALGGTFAYMAPEILIQFLEHSPQPQAVDRMRADIFSLGVVLYELFTGKHPFAATHHVTSITASARAILDRQTAGPPCIRTYNPAVDPRAAALIEQCLALDPSRRLTSARVLADELRKLATFRGVLTRNLRSHKKPLTCVAGLLTCVSVVLAQHLATLPPYAERELLRARSAFHRSDLSQALVSVDLSLRSRPDDAASYFLRGRVYARQGRLQLAEDDFRNAELLEPDPRLSAERGYCHAMLGNYRAAILHFNRAISEGYENYAVLNDIAFSYSQLGEYDKSLPHLDRSIAAHPNCVVALLNRARTRCLAALKNSEPVPSNAFADAQRAFTLDPKCGVAYYQAAWVAASAGMHLTDRARLLALLRAAINHGVPWTTIRNDVIFAPVVGDPKFIQLQQAAPASDRVSSLQYVLDPLPSNIVALR